MHSTLAKEYNGRKVIPTQTNKGTHICTSHTRNIKIGLRDTRMYMGVYTEYACIYADMYMYVHGHVPSRGSGSLNLLKPCF